MTQEPENEVLFDRRNPESYPIASGLRIDIDRCLFSAARIAAVNENTKLPPLLEYVTQQISRFNRFRLDAFTLASPSRLPEVASESGASTTAPRIGYQGEDLASTLYYLSLAEDPALQQIRERIRQFEPEFDDFEFNSVGTDRIAFAVKYRDRRETVTSVRLSSGMLTFIGLITLVTTPNRPSVLMIEEPENGLTPQAIKVFYSAVRDLAFSPSQNQGSQVLLSSHSPLVICEAWNGEDRDFIYQVKVRDGRSVVRSFASIIAEQGIQLQKVEGQRTRLSLQLAEDVMSGRLSD